MLIGYQKYTPKQKKLSNKKKHILKTKKNIVQKVQRLLVKMYKPAKKYHQHHVVLIKITFYQNFYKSEENLYNQYIFDSLI